MYSNLLARHFSSKFHAKCLLPRLDRLLPARSCLQNFYQWTRNYCWQPEMPECHYATKYYSGPDTKNYILTLAINTNWLQISHLKTSATWLVSNFTLIKEKVQARSKYNWWVRLLLRPEFLRHFLLLTIIISSGQQKQMTVEFSKNSKSEFRFKLYA